MTYRCEVCRDKGEVGIGRGQVDACPRCAEKAEIDYQTRPRWHSPIRLGPTAGGREAP